MKKFLPHLAFVIGVYLFVHCIVSFYLIGVLQDKEKLSIFEWFEYLPFIDPIRELFFLFSLSIIIFFFLWKYNYFTRNKS